MAQRILRPLDYGDLLDVMFDLYKKNFLLFAGIAGIAHLPVSVIVYSLGLPVVQVLSVFITIPLSFIVMAATTWAVSQRYLDRETSILDSYKALRGRWLAFVGTMMLVSVIIVVGFMLCVVPGIIFSCWYAFLAPVFMAERKSWLDAARRSKQLAKGHWLRIIVFGILAVLIGYLVSLIFMIPAMLFFAADEMFMVGGVGGFMYGLTNGLGTALAAPIYVIIFVLLYYDVRVRKEGFDLEMLTEGMGQSPDKPVTQKELYTP